MTGYIVTIAVAVILWIVIKLNRKRPHTAKPVDCWVPSGRRITVNGIEIRGGLFYAGKDLPAVDPNCGPEPALVDPRLAAKGKGDASFQYWPAYHKIQPQARKTYLTWLSGGRKDPGIDLGCVFLYYYGLERRALADVMISKEAREEIPVITDEVRRLLEIYGASRSFRGYARDFCDVLDIMHAEGPVYGREPPREKVKGDFPLLLKLGLAQLVDEGKPIPGNWAFSWMVCHPDTKLRISAKRCAQEFEKLFVHRYGKKYGQGMVLKPNKTKLRLEYKTASASFGGRRFKFNASLPEPTVLRQPVNRLRVMAERCMDDLDAYSRFIGRNPDGKDTLAAQALLPPDLASDERHELRQWVESCLESGDCVVVEAGELIDRWSTKSAGKMLKTEAVLLAQLLERFGAGLEPDPRFGGAVLKAGEKAALFSLPDGIHLAASREYSAAALLMRLAAMVSGADGEVSVEEREFLNKHLEESLRLTEGEGARLKAYLALLLADPPGVAGLKKRLARSSDDERREMGRFLVAVAGADGVIEPEEVKILDKLYRTLDLDPGEVYSHVHELTTSGEESIGEKGVVLDMARVQRKMEETARVSAVLSGIFMHDEEETPTPATEVSLVEGLDAAHSALFRDLAERLAWSRTELEDLAARYDLMPDGAIEAINEAAWDRADDVLCEEGDPLELNQDVLKEMLE